MKITEKTVIDKFSEIKTVYDATTFCFWIEDNSFNMDAELYEIATVAGGYKQKELKENLIKRLIDSKLKTI